MRLLVLGATGMLGHKVIQTLGDRFDVWATVRREPETLRPFGIFDERKLVGGVDANDFVTVERAIRSVRPDAVLNCIGIIKQHPLAQDPIASLTINSLLPHRAAAVSREVGARFLHISTDCVFDGRRGAYVESDLTNAEDLYGRSKALGEVTQGGLTLRTSIIGRELDTQSGLVEWFLAQRGGVVRGFTQAVFSGFTTAALSDLIGQILLDHPRLEGLYQVSAEPINKDTLLRLVNDAFGSQTTIEPDASISIDRSLDSTRFRQATGFVPPSWLEMIRQLAADPTPYPHWSSHVPA